MTVNDYIAYGEGFYSHGEPVSRPKRTNLDSNPVTSAWLGRDASNFVTVRGKGRLYIPAPNSCALLRSAGSSKLLIVKGKLGGIAEFKVRLPEARLMVQQKSQYGRLCAAKGMWIFALAQFRLLQ